MIGLGKLGLPCAEVLALHHDVIGYDIRSDIKPQTPFTIAPSMEQALIDRDLILVAVPTPHDERYDGREPVSNLPVKDFSYEQLAHVLGTIHRLAPKSTVVIISTVLPGTVRRDLAPLLPQGQIIYNPYFIAMGTVREDFLNPEMLPIGTIDGRSEVAQPLIRMYESVMDTPPVVIGTWEEAEAIKIFYNTFISFKLSFVNMIQDVSERISHMNVDVVTEALSRAKGRIISSSYMKAGMGDGGPCHPRDNIALRELAHRLDLGYDLFGAIIQSRERQALNLARHLQSFGSDVCILGVGFKPGCHLVDGSYSLLVSYYLKELGVAVDYFDPVAGWPDFPARARTFLLAHPFEQWGQTLTFPEGSIVVDPWRTAPRVLPNCEVRYYGNTRQQ